MKRAIMLLVLSALAGGAAFAQGEGKKDPLREINQEVARAGGHVGHVQKGDKAEKPSPATPAAGSHDHGGHR